MSLRHCARSGDRTAVSTSDPPRIPPATTKDQRGYALQRDAYAATASVPRPLTAADARAQSRVSGRCEASATAASIAPASSRELHSTPVRDERFMASSIMANCLLQGLG